MKAFREAMEKRFGEDKAKEMREHFEKMRAEAAKRSETTRGDARKVDDKKDAKPGDKKPSHHMHGRGPGRGWGTDGPRRFDSRRGPAWSGRGWGRPAPPSDFSRGRPTPSRQGGSQAELERKIDRITEGLERLLRDLKR